MQRISAKEFLAMEERGSRNSKCNNRKVELDGHVFDSQLEADYYAQLKLREKAKDILFFRIQPRFLLQKGFKKGGVKHQKIEYVADFEVHHTDGSIEVVDTKGVKTAVFRIKEKMFHKKYPHKLAIVTEDDF